MFNAPQFTNAPDLPADSAVTTALDVGGDGGATNPTVAADAYGYSLSYYGSGSVIDYKPVTGTQPFATTFAGWGALRQLYNGNITSGGMNIPQLSAYWIDRLYTYDQLNRLTSSANYHTTTSATPAFTNDYAEIFTYDANGNFKTVYRNGSTTNSGQQYMDNLLYNYNKDANGRLTNNKLNYITDYIAATNYTTDLDNQSANNYTYDAIGNITADVQAGLSNVSWSVYGKIQGLTAGTGAISYTYNPAGQRVSKVTGGIKTWYVRDAQGNTLAVYDNKAGAVNWREQHLYGSSRVGMWMPNINISTGNAVLTYDTVGRKVYELNNHLGNVLETITDKRLQHSTNGNSIDYYLADVATAQDYYSFGSLQPGRQYNYTANNYYRYGFNGKENDNEVKGVGNQQDYGQRIYDPRVGKFLSVDPLTGTYPWYTPYQFAGNSPIAFIDLDGKEEVSECPHSLRC